jgi:hypothetical protein
MPTSKRIDGDYNITTINSDDNINIRTHTVVIDGNLNVQGNVTYIDVTELKIADPFITVAANNAGNIATAPFQEQGLVAQTSSNTYAGLRFDNATLTWQISSNVTAEGAPISAYETIGMAGASEPGAPENSVQFNSNSDFAGSADLLFDAGNARLTLNGHQALGNIGSAPSAAANSVVIYHNQVGGGDTGVFARTATTQDELVSRSRAIIFGLIL